MTRTIETEQETAQLVRAWLDRTLSAVDRPDHVLARVSALLPEMGQDRPTWRTRRRWAARGLADCLTPIPAARAGSRTRRTSSMLTTTRLAGLLAATMLGAGAVLAGAGLVPSPDPNQLVVIGSSAPSPAASDAAGRTIVLAADGTGDAASLAEAVKMARDGDRILVRPGRHPGNAVVEWRDITIEGDGDPADVVLDVDTSDKVVFTGGNWDAAILLRATSTTLRGLTLRMGSAGDPYFALEVVSGSPTLERLIIQNDHPDAFQAINVIRASTARIRDNRIEGSVMLSDGSAVTFERNDVTRGQGRRFWQRAAVTVSEGSSMVRDNRISSVGAGILVTAEEGPATPTIERNDITAAGDGIEVLGGDPVIRGNTIRDSQSGVTVHGGRGTIAGNVISGSATGLLVGACASPTIEANRVAANRVGIRVDGCEGGVARRPARPSPATRSATTPGTRSSPRAWSWATQRPASARTGPHPSSRPNQSL